MIRTNEVDSQEWSWIDTGVGIIWEMRVIKEQNLLESDKSFAYSTQYEAEMCLFLSLP